MTDLMREVDEAMRQERMEKFWKENGKTLILCVIATVIMTGAISAYRTWDRSVREAGTEQILALMDDKTFPDNLANAKLDMRGGLRGIVLINGAQKYFDSKKTDKALELYARAAEDKRIPGELRDLAVLMQARLTENAAADEKLMKALNAVAKDGGSPWQYHARIEAASFAAAKSDYKTARKYLATVMEQKTLPSSLYEKARALDHIYALKAEQKPETTPNTGS